MHKRTPLGCIVLDAGRQPIHAMHDFFLNYTFKRKENWEVLRLILNIFLEEYAHRHPDSAIRLVEGEIEVETQYKYYLDLSNPAKSQDFRLTLVHGGTVYFIEFQNRAATDPPIIIRAPDYQVQGMKHCKGKATVQIWILAEDVNELLGGNSFANYVSADTVSGRPYPVGSGLAFISLTRLSESAGVAGELASFLLGKGKRIRSEEVRRIEAAFKKSLRAFCKNKEVRTRMSVAEKYRLEGMLEGREEGREEGRVEGIALGAARVAELVSAGYTPEDALRIVCGERTESGE